MTIRRRAQPRYAPDVEGSQGDWRELAAYKELPQEGVFFGGSSGANDGIDRERLLPGIAICQSCEVREPCLSYALEIRSEFGIFGGLTSNERKRLLRARS